MITSSIDSSGSSIDTEAELLYSTNGEPRNFPMPVRHGSIVQFSSSGRQRGTEDRPPIAMKFSKSLKGINVTVGCDGLSAVRDRESWSDGITFANEGDPLIPGRACLIKIHRAKNDSKLQNLIGGLGIAVIDDAGRLCQLSPSSSPTTKTSTSQQNLPRFLCPDLERSIGACKCNHLN